MDEREQVEKAVRRYLESVRSELADTPADERGSILQGVESHIYDALETRFPGAPTMAGLELVLAEMAPPSSYAQGRKECPPAAPASVPAQAPRFCWYPVTGLAVITFGGALTVAVIALSIVMIARTLEKNSGVSLPFVPLFAVIGAMALAVLITSTALGLVGISRIRESRGALYGMPLAVAVTLLSPLAAFNVLAAAAGLLATRLLHSLSLMPVGILKLVLLPLVLALIVWADVVASRRVWRWANRPGGEGQAA